MSEAIQQAVLYGLMSYGSPAWIDNRDQLHSELFTDHYRELYEVIANRCSEGKLVNALTMIELMPASDAVDRSVRSFCSRRELPEYVQQLREFWIEKRTAEIGAGLVSNGDREQAIAELQALMTSSTRENYRSIREALPSWVDRIEQRLQNPNPGIRTGWKSLDDILGGLRGGNLTILAARPSMGKTAAALNIAAAQKRPVLIFSLEMPESELLDRLISARGVDHGKLRAPETLSDKEDWPKVTQATSLLSEQEILINDTGGLSMDAIETLSLRAHNAMQIALIVVDYLQLIRCRAENRFQEVSQVSRRLKALAKNLNVPVLALSQLNRAAEGKSAPTLSDLRESGQIEQDADQVIFIQREEVIDPATSDRGTGTFYIRKNRHGETGQVTLAWQGRFQRFSDHSRSLDQ